MCLLSGFNQHGSHFLQQEEDGSCKKLIAGVVNNKSYPHSIQIVVSLLSQDVNIDDTDCYKDMNYDQPFLPPHSRLALSSAGAPLVAPATGCGVLGCHQAAHLPLRMWPSGASHGILPGHYLLALTNSRVGDIPLPTPPVADSVIQSHHTPAAPCAVAMVVLAFTGARGLAT